MKFNPWKACAFGLIGFLGFGSSVSAQVPAAPVAPVGAPVAAAPAAPGNLWSFLLPNAEQKAACKEHYCNSAIGKVVGSMMKPVAAMSGGLIQNRCEIPTAAELALPADSPGGAAAKIKADELAAAARRMDVRYLGTVDCSRWPEAEEALINGLRADRNECVRYEAALALGRGCCCTPKTMVALSITASGGNQDGFPVERSERVRAAAAAALDHCLACLAPQQMVLPIEAAPNGGEGPKELPQPKEGVLPGVAKGGPQTKPIQPVAAAPQGGFYKKLDPKVVNTIVQQARTTQQNSTVQPAAHTSTGKTGGLVDILSQAFNTTPAGYGGVHPASNPAFPTYTAPSTQVFPTYHSPSIGGTSQPMPATMEETAPKNRGLLPMLFGPSSKSAPVYPAPTSSAPPVTEKASPYSLNKTTSYLTEKSTSPYALNKTTAYTTETPSPYSATQLVPVGSLTQDVEPVVVAVPAKTMTSAFPSAPPSSAGYLVQPSSIEQILANGGD